MYLFQPNWWLNTLSQVHIGPVWICVCIGTVYVIVSCRTFLTNSKNLPNPNSCPATCSRIAKAVPYTCDLTSTFIKVALCAVTSELPAPSAVHQHLYTVSIKAFRVKWNSAFVPEREHTLSLTRTQHHLLTYTPEVLHVKWKTAGYFGSCREKYSWHASFIIDTNRLMCFVREIFS